VMEGDVAVARNADYNSLGVADKAREAADSCPVAAIVLDHD